nr:RcnB family protein [uncultured Sphingomonas sp.]
MRKFLIPLLMVSAAMPAAANAQWRGGDRSESAKSERSERPQRAERPQRVERPQVQRPQIERQQMQRPQVDRQQVQRQQVERPQIDRRERSFGNAVRDQVQRQQAVETRRDQRPNSDGQRGGWNGYRDRVINQGQTSDRNWRDRDRDGRDRDGRQWNGNNNSQRWGDRNGNWSRNWRNDNRYDWRRYRDRNRSTFRLGVYFDPYGSNYRRYNVGYNMWPSYYSSNNWLNDPWMYRLPEVYGPYRWVRYYDDALLVNIYTGQVADVLYNFFW